MSKKWGCKKVELFAYCNQQYGYHTAEANRCAGKYHNLWIEHHYKKEAYLDIMDKLIDGFKEES